ncbi:MAG: Hsp33 family molecular chaperone HslO [Alphaproteobacteria bacterium]|nr:Hsp33 family molecular chaperone HslO [Alphaproteobacteria bacterium]MBV8408329.1 Hsp33 family molecular chaperone HslO [Alphaproteobacteria bacterium]
MSASSEGFFASDPHTSDRDQVLPFQLDALGVRGRLVRLGPALDAVIERHGYPLAVARPLAEAMVLCATLASSLKYDGIFTLQISGDGPIRLLVTDLTTDGALRGYAQFDSWKLAIALGGGAGEAPEGYVPKLFGHGRLSFTVDQGQHTERYQGIVPLEGSTLADCAHTYFRQSEQLPTGLKVAAERIVDGGTAHWRAASLMVQQMPEFDAGRLDEDREQREDDWRKAVILMASATEAEMLDPGLPSTTLLHRLFHAEQPRVFNRRVLAARCRCSRERIDRVLRSIKRQELDDLRDASGRVAVKCEFCSTEYAYDDRDLDRIYASAA